MNDINDFFDLSKYTVISKVGEGSFGEVFKIKDNKSDQILCAKVSFKTMTDSDTGDLRDLRREVNIMSKITHPSILKFVGFNKLSFTNEPKPVIVSEYIVNGTLQNMLNLERKSCPHESWNDTKKLINIYGIASAMSYLHKHKIIHRDLKPANILLDEYLFPKIADFGLSKVKHDNIESISIESTKNIKGTPVYMSPEIWESSLYSPASDVYAFGVILYEIVTNDEPFKNENFYTIPMKVRNGVRPEIRFSPSESYTRLITRCWSQNIEERPSFDEILRELKEDDGFLTELVDKDDFFDYVDYIDNCEVNFDKNRNVFLPVEKVVKRVSESFKKVKVNLDQKEEIIVHQNSKIKKTRSFSLIKKSSAKSKLTYPLKDFNNLDANCQILVQEAEDDPEKQFSIGVFHVEGKENFPQNTQIGILYLKKSMNAGCVDALIFYSRMLIDGKNIPQDLEKAKKLLKKKVKKGNPSILFLYGMIKKKEKNFKSAKKYFKDGANGGNGEAMYQYGKLLLRGNGVPKNEKEAKKYFEMAKKNGCDKSDKYLSQPKEDHEQSQQKPKYEMSPVNKKAATQKNIKKSSFGDEDNALNFRSKILNFSLFDSLNSSCKRLVKSAESSNNENDLVRVANGFMKGIDSFPKNEEVAIEYFEYGMKKNMVKIMEIYGQSLFEGKYIKKNEDKSKQILTRAVKEFNSPEAKYQLALIILSHETFEINSNANMNVNYPLAKQYSKEAADSGHAKSMTLYGRICFKEKSCRYGSIHTDFNEAFKYFKKASENGDGEGMCEYARFLESGCGVVIPDIKEAVKYYKNGHEKGSLSATAGLGHILIEGKYVSKNVSEGIRLIKLSRDANNPLGLNIYGCLLYNGSELIPKDDVEAYHFFKKAAEIGCSAAIRNVGISFIEGIPVKKDIQMAIKYFKLAIEEGSYSAGYNLGRLYYEGDSEAGFRADEREGLKYLKLSADCSFGPALYQYSRYLCDKKRPQSEWVKYLERGMEIKDIYCIVYYCALYLDKVITPKNPTKVVEYLKYAVDSGQSGIAMEMYAEILNKGLGVPVNKREAERYLQMAKNFK